jgi:hypothetical protein
MENVIKYKKLIINANYNSRKYQNTIGYYNFYIYNFITLYCKKCLNLKNMYKTTLFKIIIIIYLNLQWLL